MRGKATGRYRGERDRSQDREGAWLTTYADAVTLLLAFFVLLYAWSDVDAVRFRAFVEGLRGPFGNVSVEQGLLTDRDGLLVENDHLRPEDLTDVDALLDLLTSIDHVRLLAILQDLPTSSLDTIHQRANAEAQLDEVEHALDQALAAAGFDDMVSRQRSERGLVVSISSDNVLFSLGSTEISAVGHQVVEVVADTLQAFTNPVLVEGHTDDLPIRRADYTNWNLSTDRAVAVLELLIDDHGMSPERIAAAGYGEHHPVGDNATAEGRARNRRVDIVILLNGDIPRTSAETEPTR